MKLPWVQLLSAAIALPSSQFLASLSATAYGRQGGNYEAIFMSALTFSLIGVYAVLRAIEDMINQVKDQLEPEHK